ncbi:MAG: protoporphyrinogen oxidase [bacterium]|nr:protoporphyrinogen oxidase [bacterium]
MSAVDDRLRPRVLVIGGGIAGLATGYLILALARERDIQPELTVLEAQDTAGGATRTEHIDGFTCEWGPNGFLDNEPATLDLIKRLGLQSRMIVASPSAAHRYIYHHGTMHEVPLDPMSFIRSDILPFAAKFRMALELAVPAKRDGADETVYDFAERRLGSSFARYLIDPMVSGIFAGNASELSLRAVFPKMVEMESDHGGLFRAMLAKRREAKKSGKRIGGPAGANASLTTFMDGMGELTATLARALSENIVTRSNVRAIHRRGEHFEVITEAKRLSSDAVIVACPSYAAASIVGELSHNAARSLRDIQYAPVDVVAHGHRVEDIGRELNGFGVLIPRGEQYRALGSLWCDAIFPNQAPKEMHLLRTMIGGAHDLSAADLSHDELEQLARDEHRLLYDVKQPPVFSKVIRHRKAIAQYTRGHLDRVRDTELLERQLPGLYFTGASYRGVSVNGCVKDAFRVARQVLELWKIS